MTSSPMQVNSSSKEFIISMLRPFCLPIRAPYTESILETVNLTQLVTALLSPEPGPVLTDIHDHQRMQADGYGADGARRGHDFDTSGHPRCPIEGILIDFHRRTSTSMAFPGRLRLL
ncbi:hypothetical protein ALC53_02125 [Atta colombica]|uniref:Uncharacterized protein n=1 Tax=Atta colombica TaxID=520822 RepID=A0A195BT14_9HYME|nr:hypothetical protein ALC53_02125 [Atta colombica]